MEESIRPVSSQTGYQAFHNSRRTRIHVNRNYIGGDLFWYRPGGAECFRPCPSTGTTSWELGHSLYQYGAGCCGTHLGHHCPTGSLLCHLWHYGVEEGPEIGIILSAIGLKPVPVIVFAQATNGILLPVVAIYLLRVMNDKSILGQYSNRLGMNLAGLAVILVSVFLGLRSLLSVIGIL